MTSKDLTIANAAMAVFFRHGVRRTSMADVAEEAGVSRQTLYNLFANKDELIRATVRIGVGEMMAEFAAAAEGRPLAEVLESFHSHVTLKTYDMIVASPEAADIMEGFYAAAGKELEDLNAKWVAMLADHFRPFDNILGAARLSPEQMADFFYSTSHGAKHDVDTKAQMETRLAALRASTLALLKQS